MEERSRFLRNTWYMAGWSDEVGETLSRRRIAGQPILLYRLAAGQVTALDDRCPHRFAPLSKGERIGDNVRCGYHGLEFGPSGACQHNPYAAAIPKGAVVRHWPTVERDGIVWLWAGDPSLADPARIADFSFLAESSTSRTLHGYTLMMANYEYGTDNLMDLSHIEFVHKGSFAGAGVIFAGTHDVRQDGDTLHSNWWMPGISAPSHTEGIYPRDMRVDHWLDMRWNAPATMYLQVGSTPAGQAREVGVIAHQAHILTPASDGTTHYFWATTYAAGAGIPDMEPMLRQLFGQAFDEEDKPMIEAAYGNLDGADFWSAKPIFLGIDAGGTQARRLLEQLIRREPPAGTA